MMLRRWWRELRIWLLRHLHTMTIGIANWSESQLSHLSPVAPVSEIEDERQLGQPPKHWLDKVQSASQVPDHWLNHIQERLGHIPEMQDMSALATPSPENKNRDMAQSSRLSPPVDATYQSPESQSEKRENQYTSLRKSHIPEHLRWRIAPVRKTSPENPSQSADTRYQSTDSDMLNSQTRYQDNFRSAQEADTHYQQAQASTESDADYAQTQQSKDSDATYQAMSKSDPASELAFAQKRVIANSDTRYQKPETTKAVPDKVESDLPLRKEKKAAQATYQSAKQSKENGTHYPDSAKESHNTEVDYPAMQGETQANKRFYQSPETSRQVGVNYPATSKVDTSNVDYQTPDKTSPVDAAYSVREQSTVADTNYQTLEKPDEVEAKYPERKQPGISEAGYQSPETSTQTDVRYPDRSHRGQNVPRYQSAQQSRENTVHYAESQVQSGSELEYGQFSPVRGTMTAYRSDSSMADARQALATASDDFWIPLPVENRRGEPVTPIEHARRIDAEQRGKM